PKLRLLDLRRRVRQRGEPKARVPQTLERGAHLRMRWQSADLLKDRLLVIFADPNPTALAGDGERRFEVLAEREVRTGDGREERGLKHGLEPLDAHLRVAEHTLEMRIERAQVEQRLVDVKH